MTKSLLFMVAGFVAGLLCCAMALAHGGGLDANGGHHDRKNGGYHYHRGPKAGGGSETSQNFTTRNPGRKRVADNKVTSSTKRVSISSTEDEKNGRFAIRKTGEDEYELEYHADNENGSVTTTFLAVGEDIVDFNNALADVIAAEVR